MLKMTLAALIITLFNFQVSANDKVDVDYFTIGDVQIQEVEESTELVWESIETEEVLTDEEIKISEIINLGKKIWDVIVKNRPVVNVKNFSASAVPQGITAWQQLEGWQTPKTKTYQVTYKNLYGMNVVDFKFRVLYTTGGSYQGQGKYIARVTIIPADLSVAWGYTFNANVEVPSVLNTGTKENPIAGAEVQLHWSVDTVVKHIQSTVNFFVKGNGTFINLND